MGVGDQHPDGGALRRSNCIQDLRLEHLKKHGSNSLSYLTLYDDLSAFSGPWEGYIAYMNSLNVKIVLGDPIVPAHQMEEVIDGFIEHSESRRHDMCFFACTESASRLLVDKGFKSVYIGSEAVTELERFCLTGGNMQSVRGSVNYARRRGMEIEEYIPDIERNKKVESELMSISREWCSCQRVPELRFMIGGLDFDMTHGKRYFICRHNSRAVSFIAYYPIYATGNLYLDLMRRSLEAPRGCMDYVIAESFCKLGREGVEKVYLGLSPFSLMDSHKNANPRILDSLFSIVSRPFEFIYPVRSEYKFKKKFATSWEPSYLCYHPRMSLRTVLAILESFCPGGIPAILSHKAKRFTGTRSNRAQKQI